MMGTINSNLAGCRMTYKHGLHEIKYQYGLHDAQINKITCTDEGIILEFHNGVYILDDSGKETELSKKCYLELKINFFDSRKMYQSIQIYLIRKNRFREIEYAEFETMLSKSPITVYMDYYSPFADSLLIKGSMKQGGIEFIVTEIAELSFSFENSN